MYSLYIHSLLSNNIYLEEFVNHKILLRLIKETLEQQEICHICWVE